MAQIQFQMNSEIGPLYLVASGNGLSCVFWEKQNLPLTVQLKGFSPAMKNLKLAAHEISEYLAGNLKQFEVSIDLQGTQFQKKVWNAVLEISHGETASYKEIAERIGTKGVRAVGTAIKKNPLCIVVPCHRVIASDGSIGGYSGGLDIKRKLLALEQKNAPSEL